MAVQIAGATFTYDKPQGLFDVEAYHQSWYRTWDVSADGKKFLMIKNAPAAGPTERPSLTIVTHWFDELRARVTAR